MGSVGIVETQEALVAVDEIALALVKGFKKGGAVGSFSEFWNEFQNDPEFKAKLEAGYKNIGAVPAELAALDVGEVVQLTLTEVAYVPKFIDALKS